jgi:hypothetical protein
MNKKSILNLSLSLVLLLVLSACGGNTPALDTPANVNSSAENSSTNNQPPANEEPNESPEEVEPTEVEPTEEQPAEEEPTPEEPVEVETAAEVSFSADVLPILESRCANCHGGDRVEGDFILLSYAQLMAGGESGPVVIAGDSDNSYLVELISTQKMPKRGPKLTPPQTQTIIDWVNQGALDN